VKGDDSRGVVAMNIPTANKRVLSLSFLVTGIVSLCAIAGYLLTVNQSDGKAEMFNALKRYSTHERFDAREYVIGDLAKRNDAQAAVLLYKMARNDSDFRNRISALKQSMKAYPMQNSIDNLREFLFEELKNCSTNDDVHARRYVVGELAKLDDSRAAVLLKEMAREDPDPQTRIDALLMYSQEYPSQESMELLFDSLADSHDSVKSAVARQIGILRSTNAVDHLLPLVNTQSEAVSRTVISALGRIGDIRALPSLVTVLTNRHWETRESAARALGEIGSPAATSSLLKAMADREVVVRYAAACALEKIGDIASIPILINALNDTGETKESFYFLSLIGEDGDAQLVSQQAARALSSITGVDYGTNQVAWLRWFKAREKGGTGSRLHRAKRSP